MKHLLIAIFSVAFLAACGNEAPPQAAATQEAQTRENAAPAQAAGSEITEDMLLGYWRTDAPEFTKHVIVFVPSEEGYLMILMGNFDVNNHFVFTTYLAEIIGNQVDAPMLDKYPRRAFHTLEYNASNQTLTFVSTTSTVPPGTVFWRRSLL